MTNSLTTVLPSHPSFFFFFKTWSYSVAQACFRVSYFWPLGCWDYRCEATRRPKAFPALFLWSAVWLFTVTTDNPPPSCCHLKESQFLVSLFHPPVCHARHCCPCQWISPQIRALMIWLAWLVQMGFLSDFVGGCMYWTLPSWTLS